VYTDVGNLWAFCITNVPVVNLQNVSNSQGTFKILVESMEICIHSGANSSASIYLYVQRTVVVHCVSKKGAQNL